MDAQKAERLAAALRANLRRRKAGQREAERAREEPGQGEDAPPRD